MDIFIINKQIAENIEESLLSNFQYKKISNKTKLTEHSLAYLMTDRILKNVYKINNYEIEFIDGKPYLNGKEKYLSLSHSADYIAIGFSDFECGLDIEKIKERDFEAISERMGFSSSSLEDFYLNWTKYEAEYKLGKISKKEYYCAFEGYILTACSEHSEEKFEIYFQN